MFSVLYVDDEPDLLDIAKLFLERTGFFQIDTCTSVSEAQEKLALHTYDAIISDYQMPGMDGIEFLKYLRRHGQKLPFILFTGKGREEVVIEALNCGADLYIQKGGDPKSQFIELDHKLKLAIDRKQANDKLKESQQRMTEIIDHLPDATFAIDLDQNVIAWNRAMEEMTGVSKKQILMKGDYEYSIPFYGIRRPMLLNLVLHEDREVEKKYPCLVRQGEKLISESHISFDVGGKGAFLWFIASPLYDTEGNITGAIESIRDITDRKLVEEDLKKGEERYRAVIESQTELICRFLPDGTHVFVNNAYCRYFGKKPGEIIGTKFVPDLVEEDRKRVRKHFLSMSRQNPVAIIEHRIIMPDGQVRWQQWSDRAIFDNKGRLLEYQSVGRDITDRKNAEDSRHRYEHRLADIINFLPDATFVIDQDRKVISWNRAMEEITGVPAEQMLGKGDYVYALPFYGCRRPILVDLVFEPDEELEKNYYHIIQKKGDLLIAETQLARPMGKSTYLWGKATPLYDESGARVGAIESIRDITDRKKTELALVRQTKFVQTLMDALPTPVFYKNRDGTYTGCNTAFEQFIGIPREQLIGRTGYDIAPPEFADVYRRADEELFSSRNVQQYEAAMQKADGSIHDAIFYKAPLYDDQGEVTGLIGSILDITERKDAEKALQVVNKKLNMLNSITRHDILNKLAVLRAYLDLTKEKITDPELLHNLEKGEHAATVIKWQIEFTRNYQDIGAQTPQWQVVRDTIYSAAKQLNPTGVTIDVAVDDVEILADLNLEKVFYNLMENSLFHGDHVTHIDISAHEREHHLIITYCDNGVGIPAEEKHKLFQKGYGKHTGLGLFLSREILSITEIGILENGEPGKGVRFEIEVPQGKYRSP